jgi:phosphoribosylanthranilate isomerase
MSIPTITMTGVDAKTSITWMKEACLKYRQHSGHRSVELAILRSPKVGQSPRYPDAKAINAITDYIYPEYLAFHLCGRYANMVHDGEWLELCDLIDFSLVSRVQVNHADTDENAILKLQRFSVHIDKPVVMQWREPKFPCAPGLHLLQDRSGGRGIAETDWSTPDTLCMNRRSRTSIGYAGGLGPENIEEKIPDIIKAARGKRFWIDCETNLRTADWFDTDKADAMIAAIERMQTAAQQ